MIDVSNKKEFCSICKKEITIEEQVMFLLEDGTVIRNYGLCMLKSKPYSLCATHYYQWTELWFVYVEE